MRAARCCNGQIASAGSLNALSGIQDKVVEVLDPIELVALHRLEQTDVLVHDVPSDEGRRLKELVAAGHFAADFGLVLDLIVLGQDARSDAATSVLSPLTFAHSSTLSPPKSTGLAFARSVSRISRSSRFLNQASSAYVSRVAGDERRTVLLVVAMLADDDGLERAIARRLLALRPEVDGLERTAQVSRTSPHELLGEVADDEAIVAGAEDVPKQSEMHVERAAVLCGISRLIILVYAARGDRPPRATCDKHFKRTTAF